MKKTIFSVIALLVATVAMAQNRPMYLHMKSGEVKEFEYNDVDYIDFGEEVAAYDLEFEATNASCIYFGGNGYSLHLSDAPVSPEGYPTVAGQNVLRMYVIANESDDSNNAHIEGGRYVISPDYALGNMYNGGSGYTVLMQCLEMQETGPYGWTIEFDSGSLNVEYAADGTTNMVFRGKLHDYGEGYESLPKNIKVTFKGNVAYDNQDPNSYQTLTEDVTMVPAALSGGYTNVAGMYGSYTLTYYNVELDADGFIVGPGELLNFELLTAEGETMDAAAQLPGDYTVTDAMNGPWAPGNYLNGMLYPGYGFPMGTYYAVYGEGGAETRLKGFVTDGTVHVDVDGDNVRMQANLIAEGGHTITMDYTAPVSSIIERSYMKAKAGTPRGIKGAMQPVKRNNIRNNNVLRLIKK